EFNGQVLNNTREIGESSVIEKEIVLTPLRLPARGTIQQIVADQLSQMLLRFGAVALNIHEARVRPQKQTNVQVGIVLQPLLDFGDREPAGGPISPDRCLAAGFTNNVRRKT